MKQEEPNNNLPPASKKVIKKKTIKKPIEVAQTTAKTTSIEADIKELQKSLKMFQTHVKGKTNGKKQSEPAIKTESQTLQQNLQVAHKSEPVSRFYTSPARGVKLKKTPITKLIIVFVGLLLLFGGFFAYKIVYKTIFAKKPAAAATEEVLQIKVIKAKRGEALMQKTIPAILRPYRLAQIRPQIGGVITKQFFKEGEYVSQGDALYEIDPAEKTIIKAPISGYISRSYITIGDLAVANQTQPLANITQTDPIFADLLLPQADFAEMLSFIKPQPSHLPPQNTDNPDDKKYRKSLADVFNNFVDISLLVNGETYPHKAKVHSVEVISEDGANSVVVRALFNNPQRILLGGMVTEAILQYSVSNAITIPQRTTAIEGGGQINLWIVDGENKTKQKTIFATKTSQNSWIVKSGLSENDLVVFEGQNKIKNGQIVNPEIVENQGEG